MTETITLEQIVYEAGQTLHHVTPTTDEVTPVEILDEAFDVLHRDGWCQNRLHSPLGRHCALGAIDKAAYLLGAQSRLLGSAPYAIKHSSRKLPVWQAVDALSDHIGSDVASWNDNVARNADEVIAVFKLAADDLRTEGTT